MNPPLETNLPYEQTTPLLLLKPRKDYRKLLFKPLLRGIHKKGKLLNLLKGGRNAPGYFSLVP